MLATYDEAMARDQHGKTEAVRITTAASSRNADIAARQKRYLLSMGLRTVCFVSAILVGDNIFRWILIAGALLLPYFAVVMANASASKPDGFALQEGAFGRGELTEGTGSEPTA